MKRQGIYIIRGGTERKIIYKKTLKFMHFISKKTPKKQKTKELVDKE